MEARKTSVRNGPRARDVGVLCSFFGDFWLLFLVVFFWGCLICVVCATRWPKNGGHWVTQAIPTRVQCTPFDWPIVEVHAERGVDLRLILSPLWLCYLLWSRPWRVRWRIFHEHQTILWVLLLCRCFWRRPFSWRMYGFAPGTQGTGWIGSEVFFGGASLL